MHVGKKGDWYRRSCSSRDTPVGEGSFASVKSRYLITVSGRMARPQAATDVGLLNARVCSMTDLVSTSYWRGLGLPQLRGT